MCKYIEIYIYIYNSIRAHLFMNHHLIFVPWDFLDRQKSFATTLKCTLVCMKTDIVPIEWNVDAQYVCRGSGADRGGARHHQQRHEAGQINRSLDKFTSNFKSSLFP